MAPEWDGQEGSAPSGCPLDENSVLHVILTPPSKDHTLYLLLRSGHFQHHLTQGQRMR